MLAARAPELARELLPAGRREGPEWRCGSLHGERGQSLAVRIRGEKAGVWADFASGQRGDALDLVAQTLFSGSKRDAIQWASRWLGLNSGEVPIAKPRQAGRARSDVEPDKDAMRRRRQALSLFLAGQRQILDTPAELYLSGRGIHLRDLGRQPAALRYHAELWCAEVGRPLPALLAAICEPGGRHVATQRIWIAPDRTGVWRKAPLKNAKKVIGSFAGGIVPLWRGSSGQPLKLAAMGEEVVVAEGIETALSIAAAVPEMRIISAISLGNMASINLPPAITKVVIGADNDDHNSSAAQALQRAVDRFIAEGREVRIARSPIGSDFNDALCAP
ncbi:DUF7146 domain-containing protein [Pseudoroseomonas sp. WGS1072]|uniref:DUF7146 domain-containing protein n=1 Tax=Roseomonas sp. WGS1072 TaxID=3366816 RepID=UPI003BF3CD36